MAKTADLGGLGIDTRARDERAASLLAAHDALGGQLGQRTAHGDETHSRERGELRLGGQLVARAKLVLVHVLQDERDGLFVQGFHDANCTLRATLNAMGLAARGRMSGSEARRID